MGLFNATKPTGEASRKAPEEVAKAAKSLSEIAAEKKAKPKRLNVNVDPAKYELFHRACMRNMKSMSDEVEKFIDDYLEANPEPR